MKKIPTPLLMKIILFILYPTHIVDVAFMVALHAIAVFINIHILFKKTNNYASMH